MYLVVGLGNPGSAYAKTRHNIGFQVLDYLAARHSFSFDKKTMDAFWGKGTLVGQEVVLAKPQTFMNLSGKSVNQLAKFYKIDPKTQLLIISDDLDLPIGKIRLRPIGSSGGQNGLKDIFNVLGTTDIARLRVGISRPVRGNPRDHVLNEFSKDEAPIIEIMYSKSADAVECWLNEGINAAMNKFNS